MTRTQFYLPLWKDVKSDWNEVAGTEQQMHEHTSWLKAPKLNTDTKMFPTSPMYRTARNQQVLGRSLDDQMYLTSVLRVRRWS
jgi:hypothetical protein